MKKKEKGGGEFIRLPHKHKVISVSKPKRDIRSTHYIKDAEAEEGGLIGICRYKSEFIIKRLFDYFDYVLYINR